MNFIAILVLFCASTAAVPMFRAVKKVESRINYTDKAVCEVTEGQECFRVDQCPTDECTLERVGGKESMVMDQAKMQAKLDAAHTKQNEKTARIQRLKESCLQGKIDGDLCAFLGL